MNTVLLRYAVEVEKTGSITRAAENLGMDQPNLSKAIKSLEESLGAPVFKRVSKGMVPTAKGKIFLEHSRNVLSQIDEMERLYKPAQADVMEFGISVPRASYIGLAFSKFAAGLLEKQAMNIWFRETNSTDTIREVESGEYRLGIIRFPISSEAYYSRILAEAGLVSEVLWEYECQVLLSQMHPLSSREELSADALKDYVEIVHGDVPLSGRGQAETGPGRAVAAEDQLTARKRIYVFERGSQFDLLREDKSTYMWVSPVPGELLRMHGLVQKVCPAKDRHYRDILIYRSGSRPGKEEKRFLKELKRVREELMENC